MNGCVAFDLARLFIGPRDPTPRGIDRVDLAYARHFFEHWSGDCVGILPMPWGNRWFNRERSVRLINFVEAYWGENRQPEADPAYRWVRNRLLGNRPGAEPGKRRPHAADLAGSWVRFVRQSGFSFGRPATTLPAGTVYVNSGQSGLAVPKFFSWLAARPDIKPIFLLYDAIPLEYPEYTSAWTGRAHARMLATAARYAKGLILTTESAGIAVKRELLRRRSEAIPMITVPLPVPAPFLTPAPSDPDLRNVVYFVAPGVIEPRKNHLLLLNVWRELVARNGQRSPKLAIVGLRYRANDAVIDMLEKCASLRDFVVEVHGLSTPALRQLVVDARTLLMPSFAEGFGLPIIEALAVGTPVIASDLAAHREAGGSFATYLSPLDGLGWLSAIQAHAFDEGSAPVRRKIAQYRPQTPADYFRKIEQFIASL